MEDTSEHGVISSHMISTKRKNKKILFDENGLSVPPKKQKLMSDSDEEEEEFNFPNENDIELKNKLSKLQLSVGNDQRFVLDDRFIEDEDQEENKEEEETEFSEERKKQLEILGDVLGKPIFSGKKRQHEKDQQFNCAGKMIRYDPTDENHIEYEIQPEKPEKIKKKKKKETEKVKEPEPLPVSNDVFYSVSEKLTTALGEGEQFSLFQTLGKDSAEPSNEKSEIPYKCESKENKFGFNFDSNKAFKYDSSEDEEENFSVHAESKKSKSKWDSSNLNENNDRFFFIVDDPRFQECEEFFNKPSERSEDLKTLRPKLKQTIRKRIRTNLKKNSVLHKKKIKR